MAAYAAAAIDLVHVLAMIAWIVGLPLLFTSRWPRLKRAYAVYAIAFVVLTQVSRLVLGECFLTTLVRPLYARAGEAISPDWFTVRLSNAVFGLAPSRRAITIVSQVLVAITAMGALFSLRRRPKEPRLTMSRANAVVLALVSSMALTVGCHDMQVSSPTLTSATLQVRELRAEHADLSKRLAEADDTLDALVRDPSAADARTRMQKLVVFFTVQFVDQGRIEERRLYDFVDGRIDAPPLTTTLRYEHVVMARWTEELDTLAKADPLDVAAFVRRGQQLVGLCRAHVEVEGRLLEPILLKLGDFDREMERRAVPHVAPPR